MENETLDDRNFENEVELLEIQDNDNTNHIILQVDDISSEFNKIEYFPVKDNNESPFFAKDHFTPNKDDDELLGINSDDSISKLNTVIKNCKDLFVSEKIHNTDLKIDPLECEKGIFPEDETENCILECKEISYSKIREDSKPTQNFVCLQNTSSMFQNRDSEVELATIYEGKDEKDLMEDKPPESEILKHNQLNKKLGSDKSLNSSWGCSHPVKLDFNEIPSFEAVQLGSSTSGNPMNYEINKNSCDLENVRNSDQVVIKEDTTSLENKQKENSFHSRKEAQSHDENSVSKETDTNISSKAERVFVLIGDEEVDIHEAIRRDDESLVRQLIAEGADCNEPDWTDKGDPPIVQAALRQNIGIVKALCEAGCDVNATSVRGETALHMIVSRRPVNLQLLDTLLAAGCDANTQDKLRGCSALHCVSGFADDEPRVFRRLVAVTDVDLRDHRSGTVLHRVAATSHNVAWIRQLLSLGADPSIQNDRGETALCVALERGWEEGALVLVEGGTDIRRVNLYHETALHVAARHNQASVVAALLCHGADVNAQDLVGNTALHLAAGRGYVDTVQQLIACASLHLDTHNADGATPLTCAVESGFISVVQMLVKAEQVDLQPALDAAKHGYRRLSHPEMCRLLAAELARRQTPNIE